MEEPHTAVTNFARLIARFAGTVDEDRRLGPSSGCGSHHGPSRGLEERRGEAFHLLHPNREHFDRVGWPGNKSETDEATTVPTVAVVRPSGAAVEADMSAVIEYLDRPPPGWFVLDVMRCEARKWDWCASMLDVPYDDFMNHRAARHCWVRIPGKHRTRDDAWEALENMMVTRHWTAFNLRGDLRKSAVAL
jgi:hypothetical protein